MPLRPQSSAVSGFEARSLPSSHKMWHDKCARADAAAGGGVAPGIAAAWARSDLSSFELGTG
eukprot:scaffold57440_cov39-Prasinocladus_malaysianus.AAC.1